MINSNNKTEFRVAKIIARSGYCSRRKAESLIHQKKVRINGELIQSPAINISLEDIVTINGELLPKIMPPEIYLYHKPIGLIVSKDDEKNRRTIFSELPKFLRGMFSVGRLDKNTSGLLLITNDGELSRYLEHPKNSIIRRYLVSINKPIGYENLIKIRNLLKLTRNLKHCHESNKDNKKSNGKCFGALFGGYFSYNLKIYL